MVRSDEVAKDEPAPSSLFCQLASAVNSIGAWLLGRQRADKSSAGKKTAATLMRTCDVGEIHVFDLCGEPVRQKGAVRAALRDTFKACALSQQIRRSRVQPRPLHLQSPEACSPISLYSVLMALPSNHNFTSPSIHRHAHSFRHKYTQRRWGRRYHSTVFTDFIAFPSLPRLQHAGVIRS